MRNFIALLFGTSLASAAILGCGKQLDESFLPGGPSEGEENCTHSSCFWLHSPNHPTWADLDNSENLPAGQATLFYSSGQTYRQVLERPVHDEAYYLAAYHFIAVQLNEENGANIDDVEDAYEDTREIFEEHTPADVAGNPGLDNRLRNLKEELMAFNTGELGPGTCVCSSDVPAQRTAPAADEALASSAEPGVAYGSDTPPPPPPPPNPYADAGVPPIDAATPPPIDAGVPDARPKA